jgi:hypothetical protein
MTQELSRGPNQEVPKLNLRRLETIQRVLQYSALLILLIFIGLIGLSWFQLRRVKREVAAAVDVRNEVKKEIDGLRLEAAGLREKNGTLEKKNGALTTANTTLNEVTETLVKESPAQAERVKEAFETTIGSATDSERIPPRVYIQIGDEGQRKKAREAGRQLQKKGYLIPGIENVGSKIPDVSQLRYYRNDSFGPADSKEIVSTLADLGIHLDTKGTLGGGSHRPRHYEIWFGKDF